MESVEEGVQLCNTMDEVSLPSVAEMLVEQEDDGLADDDGENNVLDAVLTEIELSHGICDKDDEGETNTEADRENSVMECVSTARSFSVDGIPEEELSEASVQVSQESKISEKQENHLVLEETQEVQQLPVDEVSEEEEAVKANSENDKIQSQQPAISEPLGDEGMWSEEKESDSVDQEGDLETGSPVDNSEESKEDNRQDPRAHGPFLQGSFPLPKVEDKPDPLTWEEERRIRIHMGWRRDSFSVQEDGQAIIVNTSSTHQHSSENSGTNAMQHEALNVEVQSATVSLAESDNTENPPLSMFFPLYNRKYGTDPVRVVSPRKGSRVNYRHYPLEECDDEAENFDHEHSDEENLHSDSTSHYISRALPGERQSKSCVSANPTQCPKRCLCFTLLFVVVAALGIACIIFFIILDKETSDVEWLEDLVG